MLIKRIRTTVLTEINWNHTLVLLGFSVFGLGLSAHAALTFPGCEDLKPDEFKKTVLVKGLNEPEELDIAPDGRVFIAEQNGAIKLWKPDGSISELINLPNQGSEKGVAGLTLDSDFPTKPYLYVNYGKTGGNEHQVSRFTVIGDKIEASSEKVLIKTGNFDGLHRGGSLSMGKDRGLYIAVGENTNWRGDFPGLGAGGDGDDARRTAGSTNDLRGKILRITPKDDGTYSIPAGNLFPPGTEKTRPEIYMMGYRHPYRIWADPVSGWLFVGEVGIDAKAAEAGKGPVGWDEFNLHTKAGNAGWPFFGGFNQPYIKDGKPFDATNLINNSPANTGLTQLPLPEPATFVYEYRNAKYPFIDLNAGGSKCAMGGPGYHYANSAHDSKIKFPPHLEGKFFGFDWMREWIGVMSFSADGKTEVGFEKLFTNLAFMQPMDLEFGPDGALYVLEYGPRPVWDDKHPEAKLSRVEYTGKCLPDPTSIKAMSYGAKNAGKGLQMVIPGVEGSLLIPTDAKAIELRGLKGELLASFSNLGGASSNRLTVPSELRGKTLFMRITRR